MSSVAQEVARAAQLVLDVARTEAKSLATPVYNIAGYGARLDGVTDDTEAIRAAIAAASENGGGGVFVPPGVAVSDQISLPSNIVLYGAGKGVSTIKLKDGSTGSLIVNDDPVGGNYDITIRDLTLDGNKAGNSSNPEGHIIHFQKVTRPSVVDCELKNARREACWVQNGEQLRFTGNHTHDNTLSGVSLDQQHRSLIAYNVSENDGQVGTQNANSISVNGQGIIVHHNVVRGNPYSAFQIGHLGTSESSHCVVSSNTIENCGNAVRFSGAYHCTFSGNVCRNLSADGVLGLNGMEHCIVEGNVLENITGGHGINMTVAGARNNIIRGNTIKGVTATDRNGIALSNSSGYLVEGNHVEGANRHGIRIVDMKHSTITGNVCKNNGSVGIRIEATTSGGSQGLVITGNRCYDDQDVQTQDRGFQADNASINCTVVGNDFKDNIYGPIYSTDPSNVQAGNR